MLTTLNELVHVQTSDGLRLDGALQTPPPEAENTTALDAAILLSGVGSNFYGSFLMEYLAGALSAAGVSALRVNTRGHDGVSTASTPRGGVLQGAAYEIVDDCRQDLTAWVDFLCQRHHQRIGLIGHSLGAIKAIYSQAHEPHDAVRTVVAISPPRLSYKDFRNGPQSADFLESMATAEQLVADGRPRMLFEARFPFPMIMSAATYLDKYGPASRYNFLRFAARVPCPMLFTYGQLELEEGGVAFAGLPAAIAQLDWPALPPGVAVVPAANHIYIGCHTQLNDHIQAFVSGGFPA